MNQLSTSIECPICLSLYSHPRMLTNCGHTFCSSCLAKMTLLNNIICPLCKVVTPISSIIPNHVLIDVIRAIKIQTKKIRMINNNINPKIMVDPFCCCCRIDK